MAAKKGGHRKKHEEEEEHAGGHERWLLTYADMITLLLILFVVLYSMSTLDAKKAEALAETLGQTMGGISPEIEEITGIGRSNLIIIDRFAGSQPQKKSPPKKPTKIKGGSDILVKRVSAALEQLISAKKLFISTTDERGVTISLPADTYFKSGSAELTKEAIPLLAAVNSLLSQLEENIRVEGHADVAAVLPNEQFASNWELAGLRAINVVKYFETNGIEPKRLSASTYGNTRPKENSDTPEGRAYNRRVDILIIRKE